MRRGHTIITPILPAYFNFKRAIIGSFSLTTSNERYLLDGCLVEHNGKIETPGHHFGQICKDISFPKKTTHIESVAYPYKALPGKHPYCFYVDVSKAFYQIANVYGLETSHREGKYMAFGSTLPDTVFSDSKLMRSLFVSGTQKTSKFTEWINHELRTRQFPNRNYAPHLSRAILATLHAIQVLVSDLSLYSHTDGFITPFYWLDKATRRLDERGIQYSIKGEGQCQIYDVGSYSIGDKRTKRVTGGHRAKDNLRYSDAKWWLEQWDRGRLYRNL